jgi:putative transposase
MCHALSVSASGYYRWRNRKPAARSTENERLSGQSTGIHAASRMTYGSPKVYQKLRQEGEVVNHKRVERLRREHGLRAKRVRKFKRTTPSRHHLLVAENLPGRRFQVERPDAVWVSAVTYVWTAEVWLYLAVFLELYSRLVGGWAVSDKLTSKFVEEAFRMGPHRRGQAVSPLVHSDRGASTRARRSGSGWRRGVANRG